MLRIALVGCGKIGREHASQIRKIGGCELVGVCGRDLAKVKQFGEQFSVESHFDSVLNLLREIRPDAVHITTPPQSHFEIAKLCLEAGSHVYVEKPFTLDAEQAAKLIQLAEKNGRKLTVGHDQQFTRAALRMRALIRSGFLGGPPVHMECHYGYDLEDSTYARALLADKNHWVRFLPGKLFQNIISHGIARISELLETDDPQVLAIGFVSPYLKKLGETELTDELRVVICEQGRAKAYFTFSTQIRPSLHEFRVYGPRNGLLLDHDHDVLIRLRGSKWKSYADKFVPPVTFAAQYLGNLFGNTGLFLAGKFRMNSGRRRLIKSFYDSICHDSPVPVPYTEILRTARIMDSIIHQLSDCRSMGGSGLQTSAIVAE